MKSVLGLRFQAQEPYLTWSLSIQRREDSDSAPSKEELERVAKICAAFKEAGWEVDDYGMSESPWPMWEISKAGSEVFGIWTEEESKQFISEARKILRKFKIVGVPKYKLTLADML